MDKNRLIADAAGVNGAFIFGADSRVAAYIAVHDWYAQRGCEVTVLAPARKPKDTPLGFSREELSQIRDRGVDVRLGFNESAVQIESIEEVSYALSS